jgi:hypothetical protein
MLDGFAGAGLQPAPSRFMLDGFAGAGLQPAPSRFMLDGEVLYETTFDF